MILKPLKKLANTRMKRMNKVKSLYVHIPFCDSICDYCDFTKLLYNDKFANEYLNNLKRELEEYSPFFVETIYIGGGTPTSLPYDYLAELLKMVSKYSNNVKETAGSPTIVSALNPNEKESIVCIIDSTKTFLCLIYEFESNEFTDFETMNDNCQLYPLNMGVYYIKERNEYYAFQNKESLSPISLLQDAFFQLL